MSRASDAERKEIAHEAALERSKRVRRFDGRVAELFAEGRSVRESAAILGCTRKKVEASRAWQTLTTGRNTWRTGKTTGRLTTRAAIVRLRGGEAAHMAQ